MKRESKKKFSDYKPWIDRQPTADELHEQFKDFIWMTIHQQRAKFGLRHEDMDDMYQDIWLKLMGEKVQRHWRDRAFLMRVIRNEAYSSTARITGYKRNRKDQRSDSQLTVYFENDDTDDISRLIQSATSLLPDIDQPIVLARVRSLLSGMALELFDWVLNEREETHCLGVVEHCKNRWGLVNAEVFSLRLQIVKAMHDCGMAVNYPPPMKKQPTSTLHRAEWLRQLKDSGHQTTASAAKAAGCTPGDLNYHCQNVHGVTFAQWLKEKQTA